MIIYTQNLFVNTYLLPLVKNILFTQIGKKVFTYV